MSPAPPAPPEAIRAVIVSAGRGSRLLPLTLAMPKCLVQVGGRAILDHQLDALAAAGIANVSVVAGYRADQVADHLARGDHALAAELVFNPFWSVTSSIGSVWAAQAAFRGPFLLMNGDSVFDPEVIRQAIAAARPGVNLVVEVPRVSELDDMRVNTVDGAVRAVGKDLPEAQATHRSLGIVVSRDADGGGYGDALRAVIAEEDGLQAYHHAVISRLTETATVHAILAEAMHWQEIDRPQDIASWAGSHPGHELGGLGEVA